MKECLCVPSFSAFTSSRVDLFLDFVPHLLNLEPLLAKQHRIGDTLRFSFDQFSQELMIEIVVVKDFYVVLFVLVVFIVPILLCRFLAQYLISGSERKTIKSFEASELLYHKKDNNR